MKAYLRLLLILALLLAGKTAQAEPERVTVGMYVAQVLSIDLKQNSFTVDFWLWFRSPASSQTSMIDAFELIDGKVNAKTNIIKKTLPDGSQYVAARINATIHRQWDLHRYPYDDHDLEITIEDGDLDSSRRVFVADKGNEGKDPDVVVAGWDIEGFESTISQHLYHSNYGDTSIAAGPETQFSSYVAKLHAKRRGNARFMRVAFPLFIAVIIAWCGFFIRPKDASPKVSVSVGALFSAAAGTIAINSQLPDINYTTVSDRTVFLSLGMISLSLIATVVSLGYHYLGNEAGHRRVDRTGAIVFPLAYLAILFILIH